MTPSLVLLAASTEAQAAPPTRAAPVVRAHLADGVYAALKSELSDFRWIPGDRFSETEIGQRLGVSRTPVREALFRLRNEGFLEVESKAGWFVRPIDFRQLDQLYELRVVLELASIDRLIAHAEPPLPMLDALKTAWLVAPPERLSDARTLAALDEQFHATLGRRRRQPGDRAGTPRRDGAHPHRAQARLHARRPHRRDVSRARQDPALGQSIDAWPRRRHRQGATGSRSAHNPRRAFFASAWIA